MNSDLEECKYFFYFISKNSLASDMVNFEWQNALIKRIRNQVDFIPVLLEDCEPPAIILQIKYINYFLEGLEVSVRQMVDIINRNNNFVSNQKYHNVVAKITSN